MKSATTRVVTKLPHVVGATASSRAMGSAAAYVVHRNVYQLVQFQGGRAAQRNIVAVVDRMIVTAIAKIWAWEPALQDDLLAEEGRVAAELKDVDDYIECLQHFVQVDGRNEPNGGGVHHSGRTLP